MDVNGKLMYTFRGWIAFVAFVDLGTAVRGYIEKRSFLSNINPETSYVNEQYTISRIIGVYSILKALALIHCTLFIHYKPIVSLGICSIILTILFYITETLYFNSANISFLVIFPSVLNAITLIGLMYLPKHLKLWDPPVEIDEDDAQFIKHANTLRRRKHPRHLY